MWLLDNFDIMCHSGKNVCLDRVFVIMTMYLHSIGNACRKRVINLSSKFESPLQADQSCNSEEAIVTFEDKSSSSASHSMPVSPKSSDPLVVIGKCKENLRSLKQTEQLEALSQLFSDFGQVVIPPDFLELTRNAVCNLKEEGRANLVYKLARCLGTKREDGSDTLLPVKRMPTGLIEYIVSFFNAENLQKVCLNHSNVTV